jgi:hypothetical protein
LESWADGVWRCRVLRRPLYLVSATDLPVAPDSLPVHLLAPDEREKERAAAELVLSDPALLRIYGEFVVTAHPKILKEIHDMARRKYAFPTFHLEPLIELMGIDEVVRQIGLRWVIDEVGVKRVLEEASLDELLEALTPAQRRELKLEALTPAQRRELKRRLQ